MFTRWLFTVFPAEILAGWQLVRRDLVLWVALAALLALATSALPTDAEAGVNLATIIGLFTAILTAALPAVLFDAAAHDEEIDWSEVVAIIWRKVLPFIGYASIMYFITVGAAVGVQSGIAVLLRGTPFVVPVSQFGAAVISITLLVRFCFLPFLVILNDREEVLPPAGTWLATPVAQILAWPLIASSRLGEPVRWNLAPYIILVRLGPLVALSLPAEFLLPFLVLLRLLELTAQAVLFNYFLAARERAGLIRRKPGGEERETGAAPDL